jgi:hypothetical protein
MAENTKTPPNQDPRQRTSQGEADKQKPGGRAPSSNPDRGRQGQGQGQGKNNADRPEIDPDRERQNRGTGKPIAPGKDGVVEADIDDDDAASTQRMDRE